MWNANFTPDGRYRAEAYDFVLAALDHTLGKLEKPRHVTGQELLLGIREYAQQQFGLLARSVFETWGVHHTDDFGELVFRLVEAKILGKTESDSKDDFRNVYDFGAAFDRGFQLVLDHEGWDVSQREARRQQTWHRLFRTGGPN